jgi:hypothetical protein
MGFLDKAKQAVTEAADKTKEAVDDAQTKRKADALFHDLGVVSYAEAQGRVSDRSRAEVERIVGELRAIEAQEGALDTTLKTAAPVAEAPAMPPTVGAAPPAAPPPAAPPPVVVDPNLPPPAPPMEADPSAPPPPPPF